MEKGGNAHLVIIMVITEHFFKQAGGWVGVEIEMLPVLALVPRGGWRCSLSLALVCFSWSLAVTGLVNLMLAIHWLPVKGWKQLKEKLVIWRK